MDGTGGPRPVAFVTGAAGGVGAAVARALAAAGAPVAVVDRDAAGAAAVAGDLGPGRALACPADVFDGDAVEDAVERAERELGPIGVLVNVAGIGRPAASRAAAPDHALPSHAVPGHALPGSYHGLVDHGLVDHGLVDHGLVDHGAGTFAVRATGVFLVSRAVARRMVSRRSGSIVTVDTGSLDCGRPGPPLPDRAVCGAAAVQFTRCLGDELADYGIRCAVVPPGAAEAAALRALRAESLDGTWRARAGTAPLPLPISAPVPLS
ncbi:SDR family NAD(P)-dependent oxidoreductase [Actinomadura viridis]|uniref:SDR family NAD(P)-dependent oxidoreductase n=1 Tax=Actinomadura viridis TaxID=58110 RepID=UPI003674A843